jgi:transposase
MQDVFTEEQIMELHRDRYAYPCPRVQMRIEALYLRSQGFKIEDIARLTRTSRQTVSRWISWYRAEGIGALKKKRHEGRFNGFKPHVYTIEESFRQNPPATRREAVRRIKEMTGVERCETSVGRFLRSIGMSRRKSGSLPKKADPEKQEEFKKKASSLS